MKKLTFFKKKEEYANEISEELTEDLSPKSKGEFTGDFEIDIKTISNAHSSPLNTDFTIREFSIYSSRKKAVLFYIPSLAEKKQIEEEIIKPLIMSENETEDVESTIAVIVNNGRDFYSFLCFYYQIKVIPTFGTKHEPLLDFSK